MKPTTNDGIVRSNGHEFDYNMAVGYMDDELREELHIELAPCSDQEFFDAYAMAHRKKFGETWELDKPNPTI